VRLPLARNPRGPVPRKQSGPVHPRMDSRALCRGKCLPVPRMGSAPTFHVRLAHKPVALAWRQRPSFFASRLGLPLPSLRSRTRSRDLWTSLQVSNLPHSCRFEVSGCLVQESLNLPDGKERTARGARGSEQPASGQLVNLRRTDA
jgi:hypothetical protein